MPRTLNAIAASACLLLAACGGGSNFERASPSDARSTDPILKSVIATFKAGCIDSAPQFEESRMRAGFAQNQPQLGGLMLLVATGKPGTSCFVNVNNYGTQRARPTYGDVNALARALQARTGGTLRLKTAETSAQVQVGRKKYTVFAIVNRSGQLQLSVN